MNRVIGLIDMDCFYVQVEQRADAKLSGLPCAVVQYRTYKGGGIIAVNYEARALGVTRGMMGEDAKMKCPDVHLVRVPESRGKADLTKYRDAGAQVIETLMSMDLLCCIERASIDEAYIDMTEEVNKRLSDGFVPSIDALPNTIVAEYNGDGDGEATLTSDIESSVETSKQILTKDWLGKLNDKYDLRLAIGACIIEEMRAEVFKVTQFKCSAGISHNKVLAKLACGLNKPNKQTILPQDAVQKVFSNTSLHKVRNLGGKLGQSLKDDLGVKVMSDLFQFTESLLISKYGQKNGSWLFNLCRGIEHEPVQARQLPQSIGCSRNFNGKEQLDTKDKVMLWLRRLSEEVVERLDKDKLNNKRVAHTLTVSLSYQAYPTPQSSTRSCPLSKYDSGHVAQLAYSMIGQFNAAKNNNGASNESDAWLPAILNLGITANKFNSISDYSTTDLKTFFVNSPKMRQAQRSPTIKSSEVDSVNTEQIHTQSKPPTSNKNSGPHTLTSSLNIIPGVFSKMRNKSHHHHPLNQNVSHHANRCSDKLFPSHLNDVKENITTAHKRLNEVSEDDVYLGSLKGETPKERFVEKWLENHFNDSKVDCGSQHSSNIDNSVTLNDVVDSHLKAFSESEYLNKRSSTKQLGDDDDDVVVVGGDDVESGKIVEKVTKQLKGKPLTNLDKLVYDRLSAMNAMQGESGDYIKCTKCNQVISAWDFPEHEDYHYACQLQRQQHQVDQQQFITGQSSKQQKVVENSSMKLVNSMDKYLTEFNVKNKRTITDDIPDNFSIDHLVKTNIEEQSTAAVKSLSSPSFNGHPSKRKVSNDSSITKTTKKPKSFSNSSLDKFFQKKLF